MTQPRCSFQIVASRIIHGHGLVRASTQIFVHDGRKPTNSARETIAWPIDTSSRYGSVAEHHEILEIEIVAGVDAEPRASVPARAASA